ncbi:NYN domain-containing protein [Candidatus Dojkabacteria bacterium]|nr:NYN domain-containing protein [Candidatus Dojkabacteria bacterium]
MKPKDVSKKSNDIVYAFIDSQNLNLSIRNDVYRKGKLIYEGWHMDFNKLRIYLKDKYKVDKAFLFIGYMKNNKRLYSFLRKSGYILIFKPTIRSQKGRIKGNVDAEMVLHSMIEYNSYNKAVIISGDGDFYCLIKHLHSSGKLLKILVPNQYSYSSLLTKFKDSISFVNQSRKKLEYRRK